MHFRSPTDELARRAARCHSSGMRLPPFFTRILHRFRRTERDVDPVSDRARAWVHAYAAGGAALSIVPIPMPGATTAGLVGLEATMIHELARMYGHRIEARDAAAIAGGLEIAGGALKTIARSAALALPVIGGFIRATIAVLTIEAIGQTLIGVLERRRVHPLVRVARSTSTSSTEVCASTQLACTVLPNGATFVP